MPAQWPVGAEELVAANCQFRVDRVPGRPDVTEFKQRARWQQAWWRNKCGLPMGGHRSARSTSLTPNGSRVAEVFARQSGCNFLSPTIRKSAEDRLAQPQRHQTLNEARLWTDLLSSMPMCFNLFGELHDDPGRLTHAVDMLWPSHPGTPDQLIFEWSPGRRDALYLNNRSAFDAAIVLRLPNDQRGAIGVETKYHEDIRRERAPHPQSRLPRYREVTECSEVFRSDWEVKLVGTDLQQLWLDHLLVLSMLQHPRARWEWGRFTVVFPAGNGSVRDAVDRYRDVLATPDTFEARTIEELLDAGVLHEAATGRAFRKRYLW